MTRAFGYAKSDLDHSHECFIKAGYQRTKVANAVARRERPLSRKVKEVFDHWGNKLARIIAKEYEAKLMKASSKTKINAILKGLDFNAFSVDVVDELTPELRRMFKTAGIKGLSQIEFSADEEITRHLDKAALAYSEKRSAELVTEIGRTTRNDLRDLISSAVEDGPTVDQLSNSIEDMFGFSEARSDMIARTELAFAHVQGNVSGWRESGQVDRKEWILGDLHEIDDECNDNLDDGVIGFDETFSSGDDWPPAHPNAYAMPFPS